MEQQGRACRKDLLQAGLNPENEVLCEDEQLCGLKDTLGLGVL